MNTAIRYTNFDGLLNTGVSDFLMQDNELIATKNSWVYKLGKLQKVPGYTQIGDQIISSKSVNYLHHYYDTANTTDYMLATSDEGSDLTLQYRTTGNFSTIGSISTSWDTYATSQPSIANFLGKAFIVGYKSGTTFLPNATVNATTFSTSDSDITSMPQAKYTVVYRDLLYVLHAKTGGTVYPSRAYYCDEITSGAISWNNLTTKFVSFGYDDGDEITGAVEALDRLVVFKRFSIWKYDESSVIKIADIGCDSFRSIKIINEILYWTNRKGTWRWRGGEPELISAKAQEYFDAVNQTTLGDQVAEIYDQDEYRVSIGDVTVQGITYNNAWFCWNTTREKCYIRCTVDEVKSACQYIESGVRRTYFGNDNGYVMKFANEVDSVYTDNTAEIDSFFITKALDYGVPEDIKFTNHITIFSNYAVGMKCAIEADNSGVFNDSTAPVLKKNVSTYDLGSSANRMRYKFYEKSGGKSWEFEGFTIETEVKEEKR